MLFRSYSRWAGDVADLGEVLPSIHKAPAPHKQGTVAYDCNLNTWMEAGGSEKDSLGHKTLFQRRRNLILGDLPMGPFQTKVTMSLFSQKTSTVCLAILSSQVRYKTLGSVLYNEGAVR